MSVRKRFSKEQGKDVYLVDFQFRHPDGTLERVRLDSPVNTRRGAEQFEREAREQLQAGRFRKEPEKAEVLTLKEFQGSFLTYSKNNNKPSTLSSKEYTLRLHLEPFFGAMRLDEIGAEEIEQYKALKQDEEQSPKSINNHLAVLRTLLNLAVDYKRLSHAPKVKALRLGEQEFEFLTFEETPRLLAAASPEWRPMFYLALATGLRIGELLALKWEDIDLKAGRIIVKRTLWQGQEGTPKGGRRREVPLSQQTVAFLTRYRHLKGPYVFCNAAGKHHTHNMLQHLVPQACLKAGLPKRLTWHDLRHTFASHLVMRGRSIVEVQQLLGHTTIAMTMRYAHLSPDVKRAAVETLDAALGAAAFPEGEVPGYGNGMAMKSR